MSETLEIFGREYTGVTGIKAKDDNGNLVTFIKPEGTLSVSQNGTVDVSQYASANVNVSGGGGVTVLSGENAPNSAQGNDGDIYFQTESANVYPQGDAYFNTGYVFTNKTRVVMTVQVDKVRTNSYQFLFGSRNSTGSSSQMYFSVRDNNTWRGRVAHSSTAQAFTNFPYNTVVQVNVGIDTARYLVNGNVVETVNISASNGTQPIYFFALREGTSAANHFGSFRLYEAWIYEDGQLVKHYLPYVDSNDIVCLMETVSGTPLYASGGSFVQYSDDSIYRGFLKVNGAWQDLIGSDVNDVG